jgi:hypothetical protein
MAATVTVANSPNAKVLGTKIKRLTKRMNTWKKDSHSVAMDVMRHAFSLNGAGLDLLMKLFEALGTNGNREQFKRWATENFPVSFVKETFKLNKTEFKKGDVAWNFEGADATPWYNYETDGEAAAAVFDLEKLINMVRAAAKKADKNGFDKQAKQINALADIIKSSSATEEVDH